MEAAGVPIRSYKKVRARELFEKIVRQAHHNGEPGVLFLDAANRSNPVPHLYPLEATNPCGEQFLGPYENCCLGSINLAQHVRHAANDRAEVDWAKLEESTVLSTHFLDNVVTANTYVPAVAQLKRRLAEVDAADIGPAQGVGGADLGVATRAVDGRFRRRRGVQHGQEGARLHDAGPDGHGD